MPEIYPYQHKKTSLWHHLTHLHWLLLISVFLSLASIAFIVYILTQLFFTDKLPPPNPPVDVVDQASFIKHLQSQKAKVEQSYKISQPFFPIQGTIYRFNNQEIQVYEYPTASGAATIIRKIASDGTKIGDTVVSWLAPPHFFHKERLIVLYIGRDKQILQLLENALGKQFAGAK